MKIALLYDTLIDIGGAERVVIELANELGADIITSGYDKKVSNWLPINGNVINIGNAFATSIKPLGVLIEAPIRFLLNRRKIADMRYDLYIYCGFTSIYGSSPNTHNIWYCLTPNRMLYDLYQRKISTGSLFSRMFFFVNNLLFHGLDQQIVKKNLLKIVSQTAVVQKRVMQYYGLSSEVIYAPIHTDHYHFKQIGDYYMTAARLYPEKRISLIAEAFAKMPDQKLVIAGDGPEKQRILEIIKHAPNITLKSNVPEAELIDLYANCRATIYMPVDEDYGLIPLEGMASGKMCIAVNEGGLKETVVQNVTGYHIEPTIKDIMNTVTSFDVEKAISHVDDCIAHAKKYDIQTVIKQWKELIGI